MDDGRERQRAGSAEGCNTTRPGFTIARRCSLMLCSLMLVVAALMQSDRWEEMRGLRTSLLEGAQNGRTTSNWDGMLAWARPAPTTSLNGPKPLNVRAARQSAHKTLSLASSTAAVSSSMLRWVAPDAAKFNLTLTRCTNPRNNLLRAGSRAKP